MESYFGNQIPRCDFPTIAPKTPDAQARWYKDETCGNCERPQRKPRARRPIFGKDIFTQKKPVPCKFG